MASETWRVVLASGEVREVPPVEEVPQADGTSSWSCARSGYHTSPGRAALAWGFRHAGDVRELLAPGVSSRAELEAQIAAVTAQRDRAVESVARLRRDVEHEIMRRDVAESERDEAQAQRDESREALATARADLGAAERLRPLPPHRTGIRCARCGRDGGVDAGDDLPVCSWCADAASMGRERDEALAEVERLRVDLREEERAGAAKAADRTIAEEVTAALCLAARAAGYEGGDHWEEGDGTRRGEEMLALVRATARREGAEASAEASAVLCERRAEAITVDTDVLDQKSASVAWGRAKALRGAAAAIRALPLDAGGES